MCVPLTHIQPVSVPATAATGSASVHTAAYYTSDPSDEQQQGDSAPAQPRTDTIPFPTYGANESHFSTSPSMPLTVPLSAFGASSPADDRRASLVDQRVSVASSALSGLSGVNGDRVS